MDQQGVANSSLDQPPREQALPPERFRDGVVQAIEVPHRSGLVGQVYDPGSVSLHPVRQLVRGDASLQRVG